MDASSIKSSSITVECEVDSPTGVSDRPRARLLETPCVLLKVWASTTACSLHVVTPSSSVQVAERESENNGSRCVLDVVVRCAATHDSVECRRDHPGVRDVAVQCGGVQDDAASTAGDTVERDEATATSAELRTDSAEAAGDSHTSVSWTVVREGDGRQDSPRPVVERAAAPVSAEFHDVAAATAAESVEETGGRAASLKAQDALFPCGGVQDNAASTSGDEQSERDEVMAESAAPRTDSGSEAGDSQVSGSRTDMASECDGRRDDPREVVERAGKPASDDSHDVAAAAAVENVEESAGSQRKQRWADFAGQ